MKYVNEKTGEKAFLVSTPNMGDEKNIKPRYIFEGDKGRFFVDGEDIKQWKKL